MYSIDLSYNQLTNISIFMQSLLFEVQTLNLSWNKSEFLQGYFKYFNKLQLIDLSHNRLQQVAIMIYARYQNPRTNPQTNQYPSYLDLSFNHFQTLSIGEVPHHDIPNHDILIDDQEATNCSLAM